MLIGDEYLQDKAFKTEVRLKKITSNKCSSLIVVKSHPTGTESMV